MEITIKHSNPSELYLKGYKTYFYYNYKVEMIINVLLVLLSGFMIIADKLLLLGYILFAFGSLFLFVIWLFYYSGPINAIKRRKSGCLTVSINLKEICTLSDLAEFKYKWEFIKKAKVIKSFIIIITKDNRFIILSKNDLSDNDLESLLSLFSKF